MLFTYPPESDLGPIIYVIFPPHRTVVYGTNCVAFNSSELHVIPYCNYPMLVGGKSLI